MRTQATWTRQYYYLRRTGCTNSLRRSIHTDFLWLNNPNHYLTNPTPGLLKCKACASCSIGFGSLVSTLTRPYIGKHCTHPLRKGENTQLNSVLIYLSIKHVMIGVDDSYTVLPYFFFWLFWWHRIGTVLSYILVFVVCVYFWTTFNPQFEVKRMNHSFDNQICHASCVISRNLC